jgi:hypothetical protein
MSLFGYPATVKHFSAQVDDWGRPAGYTSADKSAKVVEEQKMIRNAQTTGGMTVADSEYIQSIVEIHLEGSHAVTFEDYFEYVNKLGITMKYDVKHIEVKKELGTDDVKKVIVYG